MSDQQDFERLLPRLEAIDAKQVRYPDMPVEQAIKEGSIMAAAAEEDAGVLAAVGLDQATIEDLGASTAALRFAQARFMAAMGELKDAAKTWAEEEPKACELRSELLAAISYAVRNVADATKAIKRIRQGTSSADMLQDLQALAELGRKYRGCLESIKFDPARLDQAAQSANSLSKVYAKAFIEKGTVGPRQVRDRAFTYMRTVMGEVLEAAEYALRKDGERLDYYHSAYRNRRMEDATAAPEVAPEPAAA